MSAIEKVVVIGSGVMGAAIAGHIANAKIPVTLLDIIPEGAKDRNQLAKDAIERLKKTEPAPLVHKNRIPLITPGNIEDNLDAIKEADWIIEVVIERLDIKQSLYKKIDEVRKKGSIVSSNTSTLPLQQLVADMPESFAEDFLITHFFNPPRYMRLLELVTGSSTKKDVIDTIIDFADKTLGKGVVHCKDTPGFIANRIGCYWIQVGLLDAIAMGINVEEADAVMGKPVGVPKTGIFGLMDLIGIDLMPLIADSMLASLPKDDAFATTYEEPDVVKKMIADGYTGRKGKGGFFRLNKEDGKKVKEVINLADGSYSEAKRPKLACIKDSKGDLRKLFTHKDPASKYAWSVISKMLCYTAEIAADIAEDISAIDNAMKWGYNWKYGPFEMLDRMGKEGKTGAKWFADRLREEGRDVPEFIEKATDKPFYGASDTKRFHLTPRGEYEDILVADDAYMLADITRGKTPISKNASAKLWDIGDGVACLEFTSKMNSIDPAILEMVAKATDIVQKDFKGLVIANDGEHFSVGANIGYVLYAANVAAWKMIEGIIAQGQEVFAGLKFAPFPVVSAPSGMALGGGCEVLLHSDAIQAHMELYTGLVEVGVGVIPGWGGCKEMLLRTLAQKEEQKGGIAKAFGGIGMVQTATTMPALSKIFERVGLAQVSKSAEDARDMTILREHDRITMNRNRLLPDAKAFCLELAQDYVPPSEQTITLPGKTAKVAFDMAVKGFVASGKASKHDQVVTGALAAVLSGGDTDITKPITEEQLIQLERKHFMGLVKHPDTLARVEHMLETGRPLRN